MNQLLLVLISAVILGPGHALAGKKAKEFDHSHSVWDSVLKQTVKDGLVDYQAIKKKPKNLKRYLLQLGNVSEEEYRPWNREQKLAFWINAYNAFTVKAIVDHYPIQRSKGFSGLAYPTSSIRQIAGVWDKMEWKAAEKILTLNDIEHKILRKELKEPRIHFAIVCASVGCPILQASAFTAAELEIQLHEAARRFISNPEKTRWDANKKTLYLSKIFSWFKEDFGDPVAFVTSHLDEKKRLEIVRTKPKIEWLRYDWSLNEK